MQDLDSIVKEALAAFAGTDDPPALEQAKARYLGKTGVLTEQLKGLGKLPADERPAHGARINEAKQKIEAALAEHRARLQARELEAQLAAEALDVTLPGRGAGVGGLHPVTRTLERVTQLFHSMGFEVADGPEIETDYYNFTALNTPEKHPARSMQDTFYIAGSTNVPVSEIAERIGEVVPDKKTPVLVHCQSGGRSAAAAAILAQNGYKVRDLGSLQNARSLLQAK